MMARIEASERLAAITDGAISAGNLKPYDAADITRRLEEKARGQRSKVAKVSEAVLGGMGIGMVAAEPSQKALSHG